MNLIPSPEASRKSEGAFNEKQYLRERDPRKRYRLAKEYYNLAENAWIAVYSHLAAALDNRQQEITTVIQERTSQQELQGTADFAEKMSIYSELGKAILSLRQTLFLSKLLGQNVTNEAMRELFLSSWQTFYEQLNIPEHNSPVTFEVLEWFKEKVLSGEVAIITLADAQDDQDRDRIQELIQLVGAPLALAGNLSSHQNTLLVLVDLIEPRYTGEDLISLLAHEHGHELENNILREDKITIRSDQIFAEFFAYLEEWRAFASMTNEEILQLSDERRRNYFVIEEYLKKSQLVTTVPALKEEISVEVTAALNALEAAYQHGLSQNYSALLQSELRRLQSMELNEDEIKNELAKLKIFRSSVMPQQSSHWELRDKES
jgi:hypothetical protein